VTVSVVDEAGKPAPFVEVWRLLTPIPTAPASWTRRPRYELPLAYLDRALERFKAVPEFAGPTAMGGTVLGALADPILTGGQFACLDPADERGATSETIEVDAGLKGKLVIRYAALGLGYLPTRVERSLDPSDRHLSVKLVVRLDAASPWPSAWAHAFGRLRLEATMGSPSFRGEARMEACREEMLALAAKAEAAGEKAVAARIYAWIPLIPTRMDFDRVSPSGTRTRGYTREDELSERNLALLKKACALDPDNRCLRMKHLLFFPPAEAAERARQMEALLAGGDDLWPLFYVVLEDLYWRLGRDEEAKRVFERYERSDPLDPQNWPEHRRRREVRYLSLDAFHEGYLVEGDVNRADVYNTTPMLYAVRAGRVDLFDWLLAHGAKTPLAAEVGVQSLLSYRPAMVRRLLELDPLRLGPQTLAHMRDRPDLLQALDRPRWADREYCEEIRRLVQPKAQP
jgi:hypothetical protein